MKQFELLQSTWQLQIEDFQEEGLAYFSFEYQQPTTWIDENANASIIGVRESKLDSSIWNSEPDIDEYNLIRLYRLRRGGEVHVMLDILYLITIKQVFVVTFKALLLTFSCLRQNQFW